MSNHEDPIKRKAIAVEALQAEVSHSANKEALKKVSDLLNADRAEDKQIALTVIVNLRLTQFIPALYAMLSSPDALFAGNKLIGPEDALVNMGKENLEVLLQCMYSDNGSVPYHALANVLYNWFGQSKLGLKEFLLNEQKKKNPKTQNTLQGLIDIVNNWK